MYTKCIELGLLEVEGNRLVRDFIYAVKLTSLSWLEYWKNEVCKLLQCVELTEQLDCKSSSRVSIYTRKRGR